MSEVKNIMDALGRGEMEGNVKGSHLAQILTYLQQHKTERMRVTLAKLALICGMHQRYVRESYIEGIEAFGVINVKTINNDKVWNWIGERAFDCFKGKEESFIDYAKKKKIEKKDEK